MIARVLIIGAGYVGISHAVALAENNEIIILDNNQDKVNKINNGDSVINEPDLNESFNIRRTNITATCDKSLILENHEFILICLPTDLNNESGELDTSIISDYIEYIVKNTKSKIIIKSTVPIGYTQNQIDRYGDDRIIFSPEFLREGNSLDRYL